MYSLKLLLVFIFSLSFCQQIWSQQLELSGTDGTNSLCNGEIELLFSDVEEFGFEWSTGETGNKHITGLCPGHYSITITLADGCVIDLSTQIGGTGCYMELDNFSEEIVEYCSNEQRGSISLSSEFDLPYNYVWSNGASGYSINELSSGTYCVTITPPESGNECGHNACYEVGNDPNCFDPKNDKNVKSKSQESFATKERRTLLIVNELGKGIINGEEYLELLVAGAENCESADIREFIIDDNNGIFSLPEQNNFGFSKGHIRFSNHENWKSIPVGSLILIYNDQAKSEYITLADDPFDDNRDNIYVLPLSHSLFKNYYEFPNMENPDDYTKSNGVLQVAGDHPTWNSINASAFADGIQIRYPDGVYCHGISFGNIDLIHGGPDNLQLITTSGENKIFLFNGGDYRRRVDYTCHNAEDGAGSPGYANSNSNRAYIENLCSGENNELITQYRNTIPDLYTEIFPNPFSGQFFLNIDSKVEQEIPIQLKLLNLLNQEISQKYLILLPGKNSFTIKAPHTLINGIYQVNVYQGDQIIFSKRIAFAK